ncbi:cytochrome P450 71B36-like [Papaver somniferum]|uniref:cytochrome P450 71B36-like n=1 Tax=Papaver somniferum TaxID=3469 RepID=UPI000E6F8CFF|nr:cytochrome P450 71B36-like [Papaver somniferum]
MLVQLGSVPTIVISSVEAAEQVMKIHDLDLCNRPLLAGEKRVFYDCRDIIFAPYGEYWREIQKICVFELFNAKRVQSFKVVREEEIVVLIKSISDSPNTTTTTTVNVYEMLSSFTHKTICRVSFGSITDESNNERLSQIISEFTVVLSSFFANDFFPKVGWIVDRKSGLHGKTEKCFRDIDRIFQEMINKHVDPERVKTNHDDIIDVLLKIKNDPVITILLTHDHIKAVIQVFWGKN